MQTALIVHGGIDGLAAAVLAISNGFPADIYVSNWVDYNLISKYSDVVIVDMAIPKKIMRKADNVRIYDHHARNIFINNYPQCIMDSRYSSSMLFYQHECLKSENANQFVELVELIVHWKYDNSHFNKALDLMHLFNGSITENCACMVFSNNELHDTIYKEFIDTCVTSITLKSEFEFSISDRIIITNEKDKLREAYENTLFSLQYRKDAEDRIFGICNVHGNKSMVLDMMLNNCRDLKYVIGYEKIENDNVRLYARSKGYVDLNDIDGLEGHPSAAGGIIKLQKLNDILQDASTSFAIKKNQNNKFNRGLTPKEMINRLKK